MEWILALHEGDGDDAGGSLASEAVDWVGTSWERSGVEFGWDERSLLHAM